MGNILNGKNGIIFGALDANSIAWKVAEKCFENGANLVLTYAPIALRMGQIDNLAKNVKLKLFPLMLQILKI